MFADDSTARPAAAAVPAAAERTLGFPDGGPDPGTEPALPSPLQPRVGVGPSPQVSPNPLTVTPVVFSVSPNSAPAIGGVTVRISGQNFRSRATVTFGTNPAASVQVLDPQTITCVAPAHPVGNVKIRVTNPSGAVGELAHAFTYVAAPAPQIFTVEPLHGPKEGGTTVTIFGQYFVSGCQVIFGAGSGPATFVSSTLLVFTTPPGTSGIGYGIAVRNPDGQVATGSVFIYDP